MFNIKRNYLYHWQGISLDGQLISGKKNGNSRRAIATALQANHITPLKIKISKHWQLGLRQYNITKKDIAEFTQQLAVLLPTGITLCEALTIIVRGSRHPSLTQLITQLITAIEAGLSFSQVLQRFPIQFNSIYCNLIAAGENSGTLTLTVSELAQQLQRQLILKTTVCKALHYPLTVLLSGILITLGLLLYVVPQFKSVFASFGAQLPLLTRFVITLAHTVRTYGLSGVFVIIILSLFIRMMMRRSWPRKAWHFTLLHIPVLRQLIINIIIARWTRILATTSAAGMPLIPALNAACITINNVIIKCSLQQVSQQVSRGQTLHQALQHCHYFPRVCRQLAN